MWSLCQVKSSPGIEGVKLEPEGPEEPEEAAHAKQAREGPGVLGNPRGPWSSKKPGRGPQTNWARTSIKSLWCVFLLGSIEMG